MPRTLRLKTFGAARDIIGSPELSVVDASVDTVARLHANLLAAYPELARIGSVRYAVNEAFAREQDAIRPGDELAIIPPVSGG